MAAFEVDLQGLLRVFGGHLYSTDAVFVRELVQNALDAIVVRRREDPGHAGTVAIRIDGGVLTVDDDGVGLDEEGLVVHLSRIGASSKRGAERDPELIGQFGIGLLSAFLVAERVVVETRRAGAPALRWEADASGRYTIGPGARVDAGTTVTVQLRDDSRGWADRARVREAVLDHVPYVPVAIRLDGERLTGPAPWRSDDPDAIARWVEEATGERPLAARPIALGGGGGALWIRRGTQLGGGRCELFHRGIRVQRSAPELLPAWAGFVGAALDLPDLAPTASREGFVRDAAWRRCVEGLRDELCTWLRRLADGPGATELLEAHHLHLLAACLDDAELLRRLGDRVPFATNAGHLPLGDVARLGGGRVRYVATRTAFAQVAALAAARGEIVVDASHTHEIPFLRQWARQDRGRSLEGLDAEALGGFVEPAPEHERRFAPVLAAAAQLLAPVEVVPTVGRFRPTDVPAVLVADAADLRARIRAIEATGNALQRALLAGLARARRPQPVPLVLNADNPLVSALPGLGDPARAARAVRVLYVQAAVLARHTLSPEESRWLSEDLLAVVRPPAGPTDREDVH